MKLKRVWEPLSALGDEAPLAAFRKGLCLLIQDDFVGSVNWLERGIALNAVNPALNIDMQLVIDQIRKLQSEADSKPEPAPALDEGGNQLFLNVYNKGKTHCLARRLTRTPQPSSNATACARPGGFALTRSGQHDAVGPDPGHLLIELGETDKAQLHVATALKLQPQDQSFKYRQAVISHRQGELSQAQALLSDLVALG